MGDTYLNILKDTKDPHYRYKMPKLTAKVEGSGNGIKTVITNMTAVAKALGRPPSYPTKYFGCELGAQVSMTADQFVVNGSHDADKLLNLLYGFIRKFVLCSKCNNPETSLTIVNGAIRQKCIACGHDTTIPKSIHKLTTFIINHPADGGGAASQGKSKKSEKKSSKKGSNAGESGQGTNGGSHSPGEEQSFDAAGGNDDFDDGGDEFDDDEFTANAVTSRLKELQNEFTGTASFHGSSKESANLFYQLVKEKKETPGALADINVQKELLKEAERLDFKDKATLILCELLFTENMLDEIKTHRILLLRFCNENPKAQKYLLGGFEKLVGDVYKDKLFEKSQKILKQLYDEDIVDEDTIIEWASKESKKYVTKEMSKKIREKVSAFVKWLKEAEVEEEEEEDEGKGKDDEDEDEAEEEEEEDEDEDDMFEFSHRVSGIQIKSVEPTATTTTSSAAPVTNNNGAKKETAAAEEDDLDIDNI